MEIKIESEIFYNWDGVDYRNSRETTIAFKCVGESIHISIDNPELLENGVLEIEAKDMAKVATLLG